MVPWEEKEKVCDNIGTITNQFPLMPSFAPPTDHPLDPHNDLLPPGYALPLGNMLGGPPEMVRRRYFSLTVTDIQQFQKNKLRKWIKVYEKVLGMCFRKIRDYVLRDQKFCFFNVPEFIPGFPVFNMTHCSAFILRKLRVAGFQAQLLPPNVITIIWNMDPNYERIMPDPPKPKRKVVREPAQPQSQNPRTVRNTLDNDIHFVTLLPSSEPQTNIVPAPVIQPSSRGTQRYGAQKEEPFLFN
jgi:hypothetical protein